MAIGLGSINLNRLVVFVAVVESGSLTAAGRKLNLAKTMVSAHIRRLEAEVGACLLIRSTRRISLTHTGEQFFESSRRILNEIEEAVDLAAQDAYEPRGLLKVTAPIDLGAMLVAPVSADLSSKYRSLTIDLITSDGILDLVAGGIDVAIRAGKLADSSYKAVRIGQFTEWLVANPGFWATHISPESPAGLSQMPFVSLSVLPHPGSWVFHGPDGASTPVRWETTISANTALAVREVAAAGAGLAVLPDFAVAEYVATGKLVRIFPEWRLSERGIYAVFSAARHPPRKVRVFIDSLRDYLARTMSLQS